MFSKKTLLEISKALNLKTHDNVERFSIEFDIEDAILGEYIKQKETSIAKYMIANPEEKGPNGSNFAIEALEYAIENYSGYDLFITSYSDLAHSLERDGFEITDSKIKRKLPDELPITEKENELISLLEKFNFSTAIGHYDQAVAAHGRGEWAASNSQLRSFVEEFFNKTQEIVCPGSYSTSHEKKMALANAGFFMTEYNEFLNNGTGFVEGFWKRLHPQGSHPGLSEQLDSTFRLQLVILVIHHYLTRLNVIQNQV